MSIIQSKKNAGFPLEIFGEVSKYVDGDGLKSLRLTCFGIYYATLPTFGKYISENKKIYPMEHSINTWLLLIASGLHTYIKAITIVAQTFAPPEFGYEWAWELIQENSGILFNDNDDLLTYRWNMSHQALTDRTRDLISTGAIRASLISVLSGLPQLRAISVQSELLPGEYLPGWSGPMWLRQMSGFGRELDINFAFYGAYGAKEVIEGAGLGEEVVVVEE